VYSICATAGMIYVAQREGAIETDLISRPECDGRWTSASYESGSRSFS